MDRVTITLDREKAKELLTALTYGANALADKRDATPRVGTKHEYQMMEANLNKLYLEIVIAGRVLICRECGGTEWHQPYPELACDQCGSFRDPGDTS